VRESIEKEFQYQSSLELNPETFDLLSKIPTPHDLVISARQSLIERLDEYQSADTDLFEKVIHYIKTVIVPQIQMHSLGAEVFIKSKFYLFTNPIAIQMLIDVLTERGFHVSAWTKENVVPHSINLKTGEINTTKSIEFSFKIKYETHFELRKSLK